MRCRTPLRCRRGLALTVMLAVVVSTQSSSAQDEVLSPQLAQTLRMADAEGMSKALDDWPAQLNARDTRGWTPLMHAALYADSACVQLLLERGADVKATNNFGATALHYAATDLEKTRLLLKAGADANAASKLGNTPLMIAARMSKSSPVVLLLLGNRADVHARNLYGVTALMIAASSDDAQTVKLLLDRGADPKLAPYAQPVDADGNPLDLVFGGGYNALAWASARGKVEIATLLIDAGADVNAFTMFGSPLAAAAQRNRAEVAKLLLDRGADVNVVAPAGAWSPLMWAAGNENGETDVLGLLMERGATVNAAHGQFWGPQMSMPHSPLMVARRRGETALVDLLRKAGAEEGDDPWAKKTPAPPGRSVSVENVDTKALLASIASAVPLLERTAVESVAEFATHGQQCISCHNQLLPLMAVSLAKQKGIPHNPQALAQMLMMEANSPDPQIVTGIEATFIPSPSSFPGYLVWGVASESVEPNFSIDALVHGVAVYQAHDGSWIQPFPRPPITDSEISATALGVRALTLYPLPGRKAEMGERVARARQWLRNTEPRNTEDYAYKLLGLHWAGEPAADLKPLAQQLIDQQRSDGGWAQLPKLESDAYATGQALYALHEAGGRSRADEAFRKGLAYLLRTQMEDGSWFVRRRAYPFQPTMDAKFPHGRDAWISTAATCWAVMAMAVSLDKQEVADVLADGPAVATHAKPEPLASKLPAASERQVDFDADILPILESSCLTCHSSTSPAGQYALDTRESLIKGGFSGPPVVIPGNSANSPLIHHVAGLVEDVEMPPRARRNEYEALTNEQIGLLRAWIDQGLPGLPE